MQCRGIGVDRCSGRPETVRHTHCSERVGMCQRLSSRRDNDVRGGRVRTHGHAGKACGTTSWRATPRASPLQTLSPLVALHNPTHGDGTCRSSRRTSGAAVSTPRHCCPGRKLRACRDIGQIPRGSMPEPGRNGRGPGPLAVHHGRWAGRGVLSLPPARGVQGGLGGSVSRCAHGI